MTAPDKLTAQDFLAMDIAGRRFRSREGRSQLRGIVRGARFDDGRVSVSVGAVEQQRGRAWVPFPDFDYQGRADITGIWREADGRISIEIMHVARIVIFPAAD